MFSVLNLSFLIITKVTLRVAEEFEWESEFPHILYLKKLFFSEHRNFFAKFQTHVATFCATHSLKRVVLFTFKIHNISAVYFFHVFGKQLLKIALYTQEQPLFPFFQNKYFLLKINEHFINVQNSVHTPTEVVLLSACEMQYQGEELLDRGRG